MKKIVFSIVALIALAFSASAQDTVDFRDGHHVQGYFYDSKYDSCISFHTMSALGGPDGKNAEWAKRFVCDSDLVVYGIAAAILDPKNTGVPQDTAELSTTPRQHWLTTTCASIPPAGTPWRISTR